MYWSKFPFKKIIGIEYSKSLYDIGKHNLERLGDERLEVIFGVAANYSDLDLINFIYMFNPFGISTMKGVLLNIWKSYQRSPRKITII